MVDASIQSRTLHSNSSTEMQTQYNDLVTYFSEKYGTSLEEFIKQCVEKEVLPLGTPNFTVGTVSSGPTKSVTINGKYPNFVINFVL